MNAKYYLPVPFPCNQRYPAVICRPVSMQFTGSDSFAILELNIEEVADILKIIVLDEKHYRLVGKDEMSKEEIEKYKALSGDP